MKIITFGIIIIIYVCSYNIAAAAGFGESCSANDTCTETGQECAGNATCACYTANNYNYDGSKCVKELGTVCSITADCNDSPTVICDTNVCKCNTATHYESNGDGTGGSCTEKHAFGATCTNPASVAGNDQCTTTNAVCKANTGGGPTTYTCQCGGGFVLDGTSCVAVKSLGEQCTTTSQCNYQYSDCKLVSGTMRCACQDAYYNDGSTCSKRDLGETCDRISQCSDTNTICSSICQCKDGYYDTTGDGNIGGECNAKKNLGVSCSRTEECATSNAECPTAGTRTCSCLSNYFEVDGNTCEKRDLGETCDRISQCSDTNTICSTTCQCKDGYYDTTGAENIGGECNAKKALGVGCTSTEQCATTNAECSGTCSCLSSYYKVGNTCEKRDLGETCDRISQCSDTNTICSTTCQCKDGYYDTTGAENIGGECNAKKALGVGCTSTKQCATTNAECSGTCSCLSSYYKVGNTCEKRDLGEICDRVSQCSDTNTICSGTCKCDAGYYDTTGAGNIGGECNAKKALGVGCTSTEQCATTNAECSGTCSCLSSYYKVGNTCEKRDLGEICDRISQCSDTNAICSTTCQCKDGYYNTAGAGNSAGQCNAKRYLDQSCNDNSLCFVTNGECRNSKCLCTSGYYQTGTGSTGTCTRRNLGETCTETSQCSAQNVQCTGSGTKTCNCQTGFYPDNNNCEKRSLGESCTDTSQCSTQNAQCAGSGTCSCQAGYLKVNNDCLKRYLDESCSDDSQCSVNNGECSSSTCSCKSGYYKSGTGFTGTCTKRYLDESCSDDSQCSVNNGECSSSTCSCKSGYYKSGTGFTGTCTKRYLDESCSDDSQCSVNNGECSSSTCSCKSGYYKSGTGFTGTCTKRRLGDSCSATSQCSATSAVCSSGSSRKCQCPSIYYDTNGSGIGGSCTLKVGLGGTCPQPTSAVPNTATCSDTYARCTGSSGSYTCQCISTYYDNMVNTDRKCVPKVGLGNNCPRSNACGTTNAGCVGGKCVCNSQYYDDNGATTLEGNCLGRKSLGGFCDGNPPTNHDQCSDSSATCTQASSSSYTCTCNTGYHREDSKCVANKPLGETCSVATDCSDPVAGCLSGKCTCGSSHYDDNGLNNGGICKPITNLQVTNIDFSSIKTSEITVTWSSPVNYKQYINQYRVTWRRTHDNDINEESQTITSSVTSLTLTRGIQAGRAYTVTIMSINDQTQQSSERTTSVSKQQAAKPGIPRSLTTPDLIANGGTIKIGWSAPASGVASGYSVRLLDGTNEITSVERTSSPVIFSSTNIKNGYRYNIEIKAKSEAYDGTNYVWSDIYKEQIKTVVQVPSAPRSVQCDTLKDESITLTWSAPVYPNGDLVKYIIQVLNVNEQPQFNTSTPQVVESHTVISLSPGTTYKFRVFTENEVYTSTTFGQSDFCMTKAKLSDPPTALEATAVFSRNFNVSWNEPNNTYSEENYGYVIQLKNGDECVKEVVYKCSNCLGTFQVSGLENMCENNVGDVISKTKSELSGLQSYQFISLLPDTAYTISGTAVNNLGRGNVATISQTTAEEAPQTPYNVEVQDMETTSFTVLWSLAGPRPGQTNFTVTLTADRPAPNKEFTFTGFNTRSYTAEGLEEYWNYSVTVTATTSVDAKTSDITQEYRTKPAAPGHVSNFKLTPAPGGNYTRMKITWNAPATLDRNGIIKEYSFLYYSSQELKSGSPEIFQHKSSENYEYELTVNVEPEVSYTFEVYATNEENTTGATKSEILVAPAGVPINIEKTLKVDIIPTSLVKNKQQQTFTISLVPEFFRESTYGKPKATGLAGCAKNCEFSDIKTLMDFNSMDDWTTVSPKGYTLWRITNGSFLTDLEKNNANSRRKRSTTQLDYTVGSEDCSQVSDGEYCNGPLQPGTSYTIVAVSCTNGGCLVSKEYGPFITLAVPDETNNLPMIIGIVVAVAVLAGVGAVVAFILLRRRHSPSKMKHVSESDDDEFTTVDPAVAKIQRKRPVLLSEIEEYVTTMHKDSNLLFSAEYEELKTLSPKHACEAADREENRMRNRYINIIPFDHTRVKLSTNGEDDSSDYINANYLPGYSSPREYIGCQGPIPGTIDDFWRMTWEQNVSVIVMLTLCKEGQKIKCEQYWPDEVGEPKQYGDVIVEITSYSNIRTYDYRMFKITNGNNTRVVKHFHFLSWLDFQANVHHDIILDFIQHVRQHVQPPDTSGPMIIHCSAGVGRTGTYIALDHLMQFINEHDFDVEIDIFDLVLKLRENRQHMVQTEQQYVFIHDCVKEIMDRKRRQMENIYENQAFSAQDENIYQNEQSLYANVAVGKSEQNTEL